MRGGAFEVLVDGLEVVELFELAVEQRALLHRFEALLDLLDTLADELTIDVLEHGRDIGQHGEAVGRHLGETAEHAGLDERHEGRVSSEDAEIALDAGHVDLIDLTGKHQSGGRDEIEQEGGHDQFCYAASAASFLPFSTACSMVPTM